MDSFLEQTKRKVESSLGVEKHLLGKNNFIFIDMPNLPERKKHCEIELKDGTRLEGYLSIARGWLRLDNQPITNKSPIKSWRYI